MWNGLHKPRLKCGHGNCYIANTLKDNSLHFISTCCLDLVGKIKYLLYNLEMYSIFYKSIFFSSRYYMQILMFQILKVKDSVQWVICLKPFITLFCCYSVSKPCLIFCNPLVSSMPGLSVHHLLEFIPVNAHWVGDAI